jgi:hypothetical protein
MLDCPPPGPPTRRNADADLSVLTPRTPPLGEHKPGTPYLEWFDEEDAQGAAFTPIPTPNAVPRSNQREAEHKSKDQVVNLEDWIEVIDGTPTST